MRHVTAGALLLVAIICGISLSPDSASAATDCSLVNATPVVGDSDCDRWTDSRESYVGTDYHAICPYQIDGAPGLVDAWPPDTSHDGIVTGSDILRFSPAFGKQPGDPGWNQRLDLSQDSVISGADILKISPYFGFYCMPFYGLSGGYASNTSDTLATVINQWVLIGGIPVPMPHLVSWYIGGHVNGLNKSTFYNQTEAENYIYIYDYQTDNLGDMLAYGGSTQVTHDDLGPGIVFGSTTACNYIYNFVDDLMDCKKGQDAFLWDNPSYLIHFGIVGINGYTGGDYNDTGFTPIP